MGGTIKSAVRNSAVALYLEFAWMFAEAVYKCYLDKNRMSTIHCICKLDY